MKDFVLIFIYIVSTLSLTFILINLSRIAIIKVIGTSMLPTYKPNKLLIGIRLRFNQKYSCKVGKVYIFRPPNSNNSEVEYVIKRLSSIDDRGYYYFLGDNSEESRDSREYGYVNPIYVVAKIL